MAELLNENEGGRKGIFSATSAFKVHSPYGNVAQHKVAPFTPLGCNEKHNSMSNLNSAEKTDSEIRLKKIKFTDDHQNNEEEASRRHSMTTSELRRIARKQARVGQSKVLPIAEPWMKFTARPESTLEKCLNESPSSQAVLDDNMKSDHKAGYQSTAVNFKSHVSLLKNFSSSTSDATGVKDCATSCILPTCISDSEMEQNQLTSKFSDNFTELEASCALQHIPLDSSKDFSMRTLEDVPEEENVSDSSSCHNL